MEIEGLEGAGALAAGGKTMANNRLASTKSRQGVL
jgi:hypothetical protein